MWKKVLSLSLAAMVFAAFAAGCTRTERKSANAPAAPDFTLSDLSGKNVHLADLRGKVVLVEFWATWCPPCRESIPVLERLHRKYQEKGLVILGISVDEGGWDDVKTFVHEAGISYAILKGDDETMSKYTVRLIPAAFLVDKDGKIANQYMGGGYGEAMERNIRSLL